ncbi:hypothetical protein JKP88DRAFT_261510 [Tribonema minus]|uniref:Uncharacterized protein n=1 Tax=Tribonema minus TaxID=303371 RepID=A0A836C8D5_9STRA|nr:hypothetical protein JKP88DRAFT_261510 [Tribonema minus]
MRTWLLMLSLVPLAALVLYSRGFSSSLQTSEYPHAKPTYAATTCTELTEECCHEQELQQVAKYEKFLWDHLGDPMVAEQDYLRERSQCMEVKRYIEERCRNVTELLDPVSCTRKPFFRDKRWMDPEFAHPPSVSPSPALVESCRSRRFLLWSRNVLDYYAGHGHRTWSMSCAVSEAIASNRTLLWDNYAGMDKVHTGGVSNVEVLMEHWINVHKLYDLPAGFQLWREFELECGQPGVLDGNQGHVVVMKRDEPFSVLQNYSDIPLVVKDWDRDCGLYLDNKTPGCIPLYGYGVCHDPDTPLGPYAQDSFERYLMSAAWVQRTAELIWDAMTVAASDTGNLVCLHVRRGDKIALPEYYPNLDAETRPAAIAAKLLPHVPGGAILFIASNEDAPGFFSPLREWYRVVTLADFAWLLPQERLMTSTLALVDYWLLERLCTKVVFTFSDQRPRGFRGAAARLSLSKTAKFVPMGA